MKRFRTIFIACIVALVLSAGLFGIAHAQSTSPNPGTGVAGNQTNGSLTGYDAVRLPVIGTVIQAVVYIGMFIVSLLIKLVALLLSVFLKFNTSILDFNPPFILTGWGLFRDIANLGFVLGIIVISVATILRYKKYQAQSILWKLIVAALIVNFSLLIATPFLKVSDIFSNFLIESIQGDSASDGYSVTSQKLTDSFRFNALVNGVSNDTTFSTLSVLSGVVFGPTLFEIGSMVITLCMGVLIFLTLLGVTGMLIVRYFYISFLLVVSPVVWLLWIFPGQDKHFKKWWSTFINWAFYPPLVLLFIYLALLILTRYSSYQTIAESAVGGQSVGFLQFGELINTLMAIFLLIAGLKVAAAMGAGGTSLAVGLANKTGKWAKNYTSGKMKNFGARAGQGVMGSKPVQGIQGSFAKWGATGKPWGQKSTTGKILTGAANVLTLGGYSMTKKAAKKTFQETSMGMMAAEQSLKKPATQDVDEFKNRIKDYDADKIKALLPSFSDREKIAAMEHLASKGKLDKLDFGNADKTKETTRLLEMMRELGRKDQGDVEKKLGVNLQMLQAMQAPGKTITIQKKDAFGKPIKDQNGNPETETKAFETLSKEFYSKFSEQDWKNLSSSVGSKVFGDKPSHPILSDADFDDLQGQLMEQILDPYTKAYQSISSRMSGNSLKSFRKKVVQGLMDKVKDTIEPGIYKSAQSAMDDEDYEAAVDALSDSKMNRSAGLMAKKISKSMGSELSRTSPDEEKGGGGGGEGEKKK